jgi:hypothetical protein
MFSLSILNHTDAKSQLIVNKRGESSPTAGGGEATSFEGYGKGRAKL